MVLHIATDVAPLLASQSAAVAEQLIPFGGWLNTAMRSLHVAHFYVNCVTNYELARSPARLLTAGVLHAANSRVLREIARLVLLARLTVKCVDDGKELVKKMHKVKTAVQCTFPIPTHYLKLKGTIDRANPEARQHLASNFSALPESILTVALKTEQIVTTTAKLASGCFFFSVNLLQIGQALTFDRFTELAAYAGVSDNFALLFERFSVDRTALSRELEERRDALQKVLTVTHSNYTVEELYQYVARSEMPRRVIQQVREVTYDSALTIEYVLRGGLSRPIGAAARRIQQVPLRRYALDDNSLPHSPRSASFLCKQT